jgi:hypothetical protein
MPGISRNSARTRFSRALYGTATPTSQRLMLLPDWTLGIRKGVRHGFFTAGEQGLLGTRRGLQDISPLSFALFLSDDNITIFRS